MNASTHSNRTWLVTTLVGVAVTLLSSAATAQRGHGRYGYGHRGHYGHSHYRSYGHRHHHYRSHYGNRHHYPSYRYYRHRYSYRPHYRYRYGYRPQYGYGHNYSYRTAPYREEGYGGQAAAQPYTTEKPADDHHLVSGPGWELLAAGQSGAALSAFGQQATNNPNKGGPKVGYSLSAAAAGDLTTGCWAMRRACRYDPQAMHYIQFDDKLQPRVESLIEQYQALHDGSQNNSSAAFMLAALHYLKGDMQSADTAIGLAVQYGDSNESTQHLKQLIDQRVAEEAELQPPAPTPAPAGPQSDKAEPPPVPTPDGNDVLPPAPTPDDKGAPVPPLPADTYDT